MENHCQFLTATFQKISFKMSAFAISSSLTTFNQRCAWTQSFQTSTCVGLRNNKQDASRVILSPLQLSRYQRTNRNYYHCHQFPVIQSCATNMNNIQNNNTPLQRKRLAILVSGSGRSVENLCEKIADGSLRGCEIVTLIASKKNAGAIQRVQRFGIPTHVVRMIDYDKDVTRFSQAVSSVVDEYKADYIIMAGWMHFYSIPDRYTNRVINIHPSLIPAFCGKGYYGKRVHEAVIGFGAKITGCTVHLADNKYDHGPIILQKSVPVLDTDTADDLAARVFEQEKEALPEAIQLLVDERLKITDGVVRIDSSVDTAASTTSPTHL